MEDFGVMVQFSLLLGVFFFFFNASFLSGCVYVCGGNLETTLKGGLETKIKRRRLRESSFRR
jgi:hypothetical protein